jgi:putative PEP-CTERM system integral membrane protein
MKPSAPKPRSGFLFALFFWLFNLSLLLVVCVGFFPFLGFAILGDALRGEVPFSILVPVLGLVGVPTTSTAMGIRRRRQLNALYQLETEHPLDAPLQPSRQPISLAQIFFGMEAPLLMACTIRLFFLRDLTPAGTFLFVSIALGTIALIHWLLNRHHPKPSWANWAQLAGLTILLTLSLYLCAIALFYLLPLGVMIGGAFLISIYLIIFIPVLFPFIMLFSGLATMPWGMVALSLRSWRQTLRQLSTQHGKGRPRAWIGAVLAVWLGCLLLLQQQPQTQAFALLEQPPQSEQDRQALLQHAGVIRKGLLNAYLSAYRYPLLDNHDIQRIYRDLLGLPESMANLVQSVYNTVLTPFAYQGTAVDKDKAAKLYAEFFDAPILRGEHSTIQTAVLSNFNRTEAKAGLLDINAERVQLRQQDITVKPQGDWAEVELHEEYANTTFDNTEILYYFSLPESATVTGLWLGETADLAQRYQYVVAPRGAAQQVYNDQVQRSVDPALLEQVGPRNYRLRAFPIPPAGQDSLPKDGKPDTMHLWMTYQVMKQNNQWMLPVLSEQRNIFWTPKTRRILNGKLQKGNNAWLPPSISADPAPSAQPVQTKLPGGYVMAKPLAAHDYQLPKNQRFAFILDRSYSMDSHRKELEDSIQWVKDNLLETNTADLYLTNNYSAPAQKVSDFKTFDPQKVSFYGSLQTRQMLEQYQQANGQNYDVVILLTDSGNYELTEDGEPVPLSAPLWLVHLGGFQAAYDDATLETIQQTGGNTAADIETVVTRIATQPSLGQGTSLLNVVDGYAWFLHAKPDAEAQTAAAPIAARQWIAQVSQAVKPDQLTQLDAIHQVAKENSIVTPYSSMLVLVNPEQKRQLQEAEANTDRFNREIEDQQLPEPQDAIAPVSAVPEPAEWLLLLAGLTILGIWTWHQARIPDPPQATAPHNPG